jgi:formamidopyrimidine-DNA glycosylase
VLFYHPWGRRLGVIRAELSSLLVLNRGSAWFWVCAERELTFEGLFRMPELPDVETFKRYMDSTSLHQAIERVQVKSRKILGNVSARKLQADLRGHEFESSRRHGKYLLVHVDDKAWLTIHFGMTGRLKYFRDAQEEPAHARLIIRFDNGFHLAYDCQRQLGKVDLAKDAESFIQEKKLGPDALDLNVNAFIERLGRARGSIKAALMNQKIIAGIGNIYSDEILFQAGVHPKTKVGDVGEDTLKRMFRAMKRVLKITIDRQADPERLPDSYLIPHRGRDKSCPHCSNDLERMKISGRTAYYCPKCQPST